ncbi:CofC family guanylyltransferase [Lacisediminihabitans sp. FW035]
MSNAPGPVGGRRPTTTGIRKAGSRAAAIPTTEWVVVVPVKGTAQAKSRFGPGDHSDLALAMAADTVVAAMEADGVAGVLVVTTVEASGVFDDLGAFVVVQESVGLASAIELGVATAGEMSEPGRGIAVLLGDLPSVTPAELGAALYAARAHPRAMVEDAAGDGTALITATYGTTHAPAFGVGSSAAHRAAGYIPLAVSSQSGLRNDVDSAEGLALLDGRLGEHTALVVAGGDAQTR